MAKFTFNLRNSFVFAHMDSKSEISGPFVYPLASLEDDQRSSDSVLPSNLKAIKQKQGFSFRWNNRRTGLGVAQPVDKPNARSIGRLGFRSVTKSNPNLQNSEAKSKSTPKFVTLLLRRSPSWMDKRERRIKSDTLEQSSATSSESSCETCLPVDPTSNRSPRDIRPVIGLQGLFRQERRPLAESLRGGTAKVIPSDSESSKSSVEKAILPIPPIIISAPTPPNGAMGRPVESSERKRPSDMVEQQNIGQIPIVMKTLQNAARQLANDPSVTRASVFRLLVPITTFLYMLGIGFILLKKEAVIFETRNASEMVVYIGFVILLGMLVVLALLRGVLWVVSKLGRSFCELDLEEVFERGIFVDSDGLGERLTEADFIVGNLMT